VIDPRAVIDPGAELDEGVKIGPFAVIGEEVSIGSGTEIGPHAVIRGPTVIGRDNRIFQFASVGEDPQDMKYAGEHTRLEIGDGNLIREFVTIHRGTVQDNGVTRVGDANLLMAYTHVAHDCQISNHVILANAASLGGHVAIDDWAILGGFSIVHQFCRIGAHSFAAMGSVISKDVPAYVTVGGHPAKPHGLNAEGLKRRGFSAASLGHLKRAYKTLYHSGLKLDEAIAALEEQASQHREVMPLVELLRASARSIVR
jgi:UDP-N-acetylglucosamine acyltransferase